MTVSNVINKRANVAPKTREKVLRAINKLGYVPGHAGRSLRTNKNWAVGFLLIDENARYLNDPLNADVAAGLSKTLPTLGYSLIVELGRPRLLHDLNAFQRRLVDALVIASSGGPDWIAELEAATEGLEIPRVFVQTAPASSSVSVISLANYEGAMMLADHLAARDVGSVLIVDTELEWHAFSERKRGLAEGLSTSGRQVHIEIVKAASETYEDAKAALLEYLEHHAPPDAVVGLNDYLAIAAMRGLEERGFTIPGDVRIAGFNGAEIVNYVTPRITTVLGSTFDLGACAARIATGHEKHPVRRSLPVMLLRGETT